VTLLKTIDGRKATSPTRRVFAGTIAENDDDHLAPLIFESFAGDIARRAARIPPITVLETAAIRAGAQLLRR
jgi:hypothetical protein